MKLSASIVLVALCALFSSTNAIRAEFLDSSCEYNTYMCCWTKNDNGVQDNTDVCRSAKPNKKGNLLEFPGDSEGDVHCHGMVWADGASVRSFITPLFRFINTFDHGEARGYYGSLRRTPKCGCIEDMAPVTRADCTTYSSQGLVACENNDLRTHYEGEMNSPKGELPTSVNLVGTCDNA